MKKSILIISFVLLIFLTGCKEEEAGRYDSDYSCSIGDNLNQSDELVNILDVYDEYLDNSNEPSYDLVYGQEYERSYFDQDADFLVEFDNDYTMYLEQYIEDIELSKTEGIIFDECETHVSDGVNDIDYMFSIDDNYFSLKVTDQRSTSRTVTTFFELDIIDNHFNYRLFVLSTDSETNEIIERNYIEYIEDESFVHYYETFSMMVYNNQNKESKKSITLMTDGAHGNVKELHVTDLLNGYKVEYDNNSNGELEVVGLELYEDNNYIMGYSTFSEEISMNWNIMYLDGWDTVEYNQFLPIFLEDNNVLDLGDTTCISKNTNGYIGYCRIFQPLPLTESIFKGEGTPFEFTHITYEFFNSKAAEVEDKANEYLDEYGILLDFETRNQSLDYLFNRYIDDSN